MPTTDQDARALTYLAKRLREETYGANTWDEAGIHAVIVKLIGRNLPSVVEQVTRHASDPEAKTPGAINRPFLPDAPKAGANYPPTPKEACDMCGRRASEHVGVYGDHDFAPLGSGAARKASSSEQARAVLARIQQNACGHGVDRSKGKCNDCATETEPSKETA